MKLRALIIGMLIGGQIAGGQWTLYEFDQAAQKTEFFWLRMCAKAKKNDPVCYGPVPVGACLLFDAAHCTDSANQQSRQQLNKKIDGFNERVVEWFKNARADDPQAGARASVEFRAIWADLNALRTFGHELSYANKIDPKTGHANHIPTGLERRWRSFAGYSWRMQLLILGIVGSVLLLLGKKLVRAHARQQKANAVFLEAESCIDEIILAHQKSRKIPDR